MKNKLTCIIRSNYFFKHNFSQFKLFSCWKSSTGNKRLIDLCDSKNAIHDKLLLLSTSGLQVAIQPGKVKGYEAGHGQPQQQHVTSFPCLKGTESKMMKLHSVK